MLEQFGLTEKRKSRARELSGGMKRRVQIAKALVHDPPILILDEPTAGVDIELRHMLWDYLKQINSEGKTILLTTHYIEEAEFLCDQIAIINKGKIIIEGSLASVKQSHRSNAVDVRFSGELNSEKAKTYFSDVKIEGASLSGVLSCDPRDFLSWINTCVTVESFQIQVPSLEQIFIEEVKKAS